MQVTRGRVRLWAAVLVLAWLPGVTFFGHWEDLAMPLVGEAGSSFVSHDHDDHANHCHGNFGDCGSQGGGELTPATSLVAAVGGIPPAFSAALSLSRATAPPSETVAPAAPPPRVA